MFDLDFIDIKKLTYFLWKATVVGSVIGIMFCSMFAIYLLIR
jgi:hypothetical protein